MIKPKYSFGKAKATFKLKEEFVNRHKAKEIFISSMDFSAEEYKIIMYHGVGGIGKSSLKKEIIQIHDKSYGESAVRFYFDFSTPENRNLGEALIRLVDSCESKRKYRFECFELAYSLYFKRKFPDAAYNREKEDLASKFDIGLSIISIFDSGITQTTMSIVDKFTKLLKHRKLDDEIKADLKNFDNLSVNEIEERLPAYFEYDLRFIKSENPEINILFIIDTFEALNIYSNEVIHRNKNERWVKDLIACLPSNLFVIFGREKIQWGEEWEKHIELFELENLDMEYSYEYLKRAGITDDNILRKIVESCDGYPFYLSLGLKTYADIINDGRVPMEKDFGGSYPEIIERFIYNLPTDEVELLKILSIPRFYTNKIFILLINEFIAGYPITKFNLFNEYSFVTSEKEKYFIHLLMKEGLKKYIDDDVYVLVNRVLFSYYEKLFEEQCLKDLYSEMIYHKCESADIQDFYLWIKDSKLKYLLDLQRQGEQGYIISIILMIINKYGLKDLPIELVNIYIDIVHLGGNYEDAISICEEYLSNYTEEEIITDKNILKIAIRKIHHSMFCYPVDNLIKSAKEIAEYNIIIESKDEYGELLFLIGGNLGVLTGDFVFAENWLNRTLNFAKDNNKLDLELRAVRKLVDIYAVNGNIKEALELIEKYISIDSELESRYHIYLIGTLGEVYRKLNRYEDAQYCFDRLEKNTIEKNISGWTAHSYLGQSMVCLCKGEINKGLEYNRKAIEIYEKINQKWGKINSKTIELLFKLKDNNDDNILKELNDVKDEAQMMNYSYNVEIINELITNKDCSEFYLLFL